MTETHLQERLIDTKSGRNGKNMSKNLLVETTESPLSLEESKDGRCIVRGEFGRCGVPTKNGRIYSEKLMQREIDKLQESIRRGRMWGCLDHPESGKTSLRNVSHVVTGLEIKDGGVVWGEARILDTPDGKVLKSLYKEGFDVPVSSRGYGSTAPAKNGTTGEDVQDDYNLKTYDFVSDPAVETAYPSLYTEDVDDKTLAEMIISEFPCLVEELQEKYESINEEEKSTNRKNIDKELIDLNDKKIVENFEKRLRDEIVKLKETVSAELREEFEGDPEIAGAKGVLAAIAEMVDVYKTGTDEDSVNALIKAKELEVSEAKHQVEEITSLAKKAAHELYIERKVGKHPMSESLKTLLRGRDFNNSKEIDESIEIILKDLPSSEDTIPKVESEIREENAELRSSVTLLEGKVEELESKLKRASELGQRIDQQRVREVQEAQDKISTLEGSLGEAKLELDEARDLLQETEENARKKIDEANVEIYKREKVGAFTNGRELLALMESVKDKATVDNIVEQKGLGTMLDPSLETMRRSLSKGKTDSNALFEDKNGVNSYGKAGVRNEFGYSMEELADLAGIPAD